MNDDKADHGECGQPVDTEKIGGTAQRHPGWAEQQRSDQGRDTPPDREDRQGTPKQSA